MENLKSILEAVLFAAGDSVPLSRLSLILAAEENVIEQSLEELCAEYVRENRGVRIVRTDDSYQMCSSPEFYDYAALITESYKEPSLTQPALEVLSVVAYYQPVTRAYIDKVRGVDSAYTLGMLCRRGLVEQCGRLEVPGRPLLYKTGELFLRSMGIQSLKELPELKEAASSDENIVQLRNEIEKIQKSRNSEQYTISDLA